MGGPSRHLRQWLADGSVDLMDANQLMLTLFTFYFNADSDVIDQTAPDRDGGLSDFADGRSVMQMMVDAINDKATELSLIHI